MTKMRIRRHCKMHIDFDTTHLPIYFGKLLTMFAPFFIRFLLFLNK